MIKDIFEEHKGRHRYRRMTMELHNGGFNINYKTVSKLMKELGLQCFVRAQKYKSYKGAVGKICDNLLNREFEAEKPNEKWVTEFKVHNEKLYLSPIVDLFNGEVISFNLSRHSVFTQVVDMLENVQFQYEDYSKSMEYVTENTFVYFEPLYFLSNDGITCSRWENGNSK